VLAAILPHVSDAHINIICDSFIHPFIRSCMHSHIFIETIHFHSPPSVSSLSLLGSTRYVIGPFCASCCVSDKLVNFITWLGYMNSALNPLIYTVFNLDYRRAFKKLLGIKA
jgi:hypothetical protein